MNRPPMQSSFESPVGHGVPPNTRASPARHTIAPGAHEAMSPSRSAPRYDGSRTGYEQFPPMHELPQRASHLHMPGVSTYIAHYHYYNFNGNCTVQQASGDGQPNTIQMVHSSVAQQGAAPQQGPRIDIPPVPPPMHEPLGAQRGASRSYAQYGGEQHVGADEGKRQSMPLPVSSHFSALGGPSGHLAPIPGATPSPLGVPGGSGLPRHQGSFLTSSRLGKPPSVVGDTPALHGQSALFPRMRSSLEGGPPIALAPLQGPPPTLRTISSMQSEQRKISSGRPTKRTRLSRGMNIPMAAQDVGRGQIGPGSASGAVVGAVGTARATGASAGSDSNCGSASEDKRLSIHRAGGKGYDLDRVAPNATSSSPSHGEYAGGVGSGGAGRGEGFERSSSAPTLRGRGAEESTSNDWEAVVEMYTTGKGTEDGVALKNITKGDGRRVSDRKLLEKRRTIGKTYECLGAERFEAAIGYKWENGVRRKQKMYHVISRCRVVNAMRKAGESIPGDFMELTELIDERIAEKEAAKEGRSAGGRRASGGGGVSGGVSGGVGGGVGGGTGGGASGVGSGVGASGGGAGVGGNGVSGMGSGGSGRYSSVVGVEGLRSLGSGANAGRGLGRGVSGGGAGERLYR